MFNDKERSSIWGLGAGAAASGGVGYGMYKHWDAFSQIGSMGNAVSMSSVASIASEMPGFKTGRMAAEAGIVDSRIESMALKFESKSGLGNALTDIHGATYRSIMAGGLTSHDKAISALSLIGKQESGADAYKAAMSLVNKHG